ncbi:MAG: helix-turn-helix transcriptional regulator [Eubacteriales bacterium]|nr:helix-turn-helix transcriptional regulator [Eubacteriales bacterium]
MHADNLDFAVRLSKAIAAQFGKDCEVVVYDLKSCPAEHSIVAIENGHVSGRRCGDGPSRLVLDALETKNGRAKDRLAFLTKGRNGKILKSSNVYLRDENGEIIGMLAINYDISLMVAMQHALKDLTKEGPDEIRRSEMISVTALLDELIDQSIQLVGKPIALMNKSDKVRAIRYLKDSGAFLITKSGPKVCEIFGISKYTLYSYIDALKNA